MIRATKLFIGAIEYVAEKLIKQWSFVCSAGFNIGMWPASTCRLTIILKLKTFERRAGFDIGMWPATTCRFVNNLKLVGSISLDKNIAGLAPRKIIASVTLTKRLDTYCVNRYFYTNRLTFWLAEASRLSLGRFKNLTLNDKFFEAHLRSHF